ncbi:MAG TPA: glycine betaine ABC transporter substrate-binding protein [Gammaproteobacteria bacterium]|nr:glycine betaine ABC transporter substrate-binding protein [Gammaproteobacteria bacterium]
MLAALVLGLVAFAAHAAPPHVVVGSKAFTESIILGDIAADLAREAGATVTHRRELGGTRVVWDALVRGDIDIYAAYTGTLAREIFAGEHVPDRRAALARALARHHIRMGPPLGFNNTYALGMASDVARRLGIHTVSDLKRYPDLRFGFSNEFMDRADGWPGLKGAYNLPQTDVRGLEHALAYRALAAGAIDVTDVYSTDANILYYHLRLLRDDRQYFPDYRAVFLYRADLARRAPKVVERIEDFANRISTDDMRRMNAAVKLHGRADTAVAAQFIGQPAEVEADFWDRLAQRTGEHLYLVGLSLAAAILIAIPLGIAAARWRLAGQAILAVVGIAQTIPALALLVFMIPLLGIGGPPAMLALFLYSLLPIVRNTHAGLIDIDPALAESAQALGLSPFARLRLVELPLALRPILAGIKTAAVINIGTATLAALIGAGGYGQPILTGIRLASVPLILEGAVPAALLALVVQGLFEVAERLLGPHRTSGRSGQP